MRYALISLAVGLILLMTGGCASSPPVTEADPLSLMPDDFSLDVTILAGEDSGAAWEAHMRPSRLVLFSDGSLHYGVYPGARGSEWLPGYTRSLSRRQVADVWSHLRQLGLAEPSAGDEMINFDLVSPPPQRLVHLLAVTGNDDRWVFTRSYGPGDATDPALTELIRHLADLAWAADLPEGRIIVQPRRYDLGPDPYARYRK